MCKSCEEQLSYNIQLDKEKMTQLVVWLLLVAFAQISLLQDDGEPSAVRRRLTADFKLFQYDDNNYIVCNEELKVTYLVVERKCVTNEDLLEECSSAIVPTESREMIAVSSTSSNVTRLTVTAEEDGGVTFHFRKEEKPLDSSLCHIASLEVYRGRSQAIKIDHDGFSLGPNGTIEINYSEVAYNREEYVGELYRMNLLCSGGELPESGCLFFKVIGTTNITNAKFNCTVPGVLVGFYEECNIPTTRIISTTASPITSLDLTTTGLERGGTYFLIVVICGVLAVVLVIAILVVCLSVCLLRRKTRPSSLKTVSLGQDVSCKDESSLQDLNKKNGRVSVQESQDYEIVNSNGGAGTHESHIYAVLETPRNSSQQNANPNKNLNKAQKSHNNGQREHQQEPVHGNADEQQVAQYEIPNTKLNSSKLRSREGFSDDPLEHKYAELEQPVAHNQLTQQTQDSVQQVHHYDAPPREDHLYYNRPHHSSFEEQCNSVNHVYAILEKPA